MEKARKRPILGFIGIGHLGSMLVRKFVETKAIDAQAILASNRTPEKATLLADSIGIRTENNQIVAKHSDVVFICVPPLEVRNVLKHLGDLLTPDELLVCTAADVSLNLLQTLCRARLARAFPSIVSESLKGVTHLAFGNNATADDREFIKLLFCAIGDCSRGG